MLAGAAPGYFDRGAKEWGEWSPSWVCIRYRLTLPPHSSSSLFLLLSLSFLPFFSFVFSFSSFSSSFLLFFANYRGCVCPHSPPPCGAAPVDSFYEGRNINNSMMNVKRGRNSYQKLREFNFSKLVSLISVNMLFQTLRSLQVYSVLLPFFQTSHLSKANSLKERIYFLTWAASCFDDFAPKTRLGNPPVLPKLEVKMKRVISSSIMDLPYTVEILN